MKIYNGYILIITTLFLLTTVILAALGQKQLEYYYIAYIVEAIIVIEIYVHFNARTRSGLNPVSNLLSGGFLVILSLQVIKILTL